MAVEAVFTPALKSEGVVTVTLSESEAVDFARSGYFPGPHRGRFAEQGEKRYVEARDKIRKAIHFALPLNR